MNTQTKADSLEQEATNQLRDYISRRFKDHLLADLISGVLEAQGFETKVSPPGPDGAVDITASSGSLDFPSQGYVFRSSRKILRLEFRFIENSGTKQT